MRFSYDRRERSLVLADGCEVLVHDAVGGQSRWRSELDADVFAVASTSDRVLAIDETGTLRWFDGATGAEAGTVALGAPPLALAAEGEGLAAVALPSGVVLRTESSEVAVLPIPEASLLAFSEAGLAVAAGPQLVTFDRSGRETRRQGMSHIITAMCRLGPDVWAVAVGARVMHVHDDGSMEHLTHTPDGRMVVDMAANEAGDRLAMQLGDRRIAVITWPAKANGGEVVYNDRDICGVAFGAKRWLGIGLEGGDGNEIDLATGTTHRTEPHEGRQRNSWIPRVVAQSDDADGVDADEIEFDMTEPHRPDLDGGGSDTPSSAPQARSATPAPAPPRAEKADTPAPPPSSAATSSRSKTPAPPPPTGSPSAAVSTDPGSDGGFNVPPLAIVWGLAGLLAGLVGLALCLGVLAFT